MRLIRCDIGNAGEVHKTYTEYCRDMKIRTPKPEVWFYKFSDQSYYCFLFKHGKRIVGMIWGEFCPYYEENLVKVHGFFIRRGFRGKIKFIRGSLEEFTDSMKKLGTKTVEWSRAKNFKERVLS